MAYRKFFLALLATGLELAATNSSSSNCSSSDLGIQLMEMDQHREIVELCVDGDWVAACGDNWGELETSTACRELGFGNFGNFTWNGTKVDTLLSPLLNCSQAEDSLFKCISDKACKGSYTPRIQCHTHTSPSSSIDGHIQPTSTTQKSTISTHISGQYISATLTAILVSKSPSRTHVEGNQQSPTTYTPAVGTKGCGYPAVAIVFLTVGLLLTIIAITVLIIALVTILVVKRRKKTFTIQRPGRANSELEVRNSIYSNKQREDTASVDCDFKTDDEPLSPIYEDIKEQAESTRFQSLVESDTFDDKKYSSVIIQ